VQSPDPGKIKERINSKNHAERVPGEMHPRLVVKDHGEKRAMDLQTVIVPNKTKIPELVHEKIHSRTSRTHHLRQRGLAYIRNHGLGDSFLAEMRQKQENSRQSFLARIEELVDQIFFVADVSP
jgi:hypothetical protein